MRGRGAWGAAPSGPAGCLLGLLAAATLVSGCEEAPHPEPDAALTDAGPDADARPLQDTGLDAARPDGWVDGSPCDATFIELPPAGDSFISKVSNAGRWVAYDYSVGSQFNAPDVYLYDLETCSELRVTRNTDLHQHQPFVWGSRSVYSEKLDAEYNYALTAFDIATGSRTHLTHATGISHLGTIGDFAVYAATPPGLPSESQDFYLFNISTGQTTLLALGDEGAASGGDISPTHCTWPMNIQGLPTQGIHYVEMATGHMTQVPESENGGYPTTWGDWVVWEDWRSGGPDLWGVRMGAGEQVHVTDNGAYNGYPRLRENLLCFRTTLWAGGLGWDLALLDLDTWVVRRVTATTHPGYRCAYADSGWLVYRKQVRQDYWGYDKIYAVDLVANGILDRQGHVVPE